MIYFLFFAAKGDVTITIGDEDLLGVMLGKINPQQVKIVPY